MKKSRVEVENLMTEGLFWATVTTRLLDDKRCSTAVKWPDGLAQGGNPYTVHESDDTSQHIFVR